jgi:hypothetical protein
VKIPDIRWARRPKGSPVEFTVHGMERAHDRSVEDLLRDYENATLRDRDGVWVQVANVTPGSDHTWTGRMVGLYSGDGRHTHLPSSLREDDPFALVIGDEVTFDASNVFACVATAPSS